MCLVRPSRAEYILQNLTLNLLVGAFDQTGIVATCKRARHTDKILHFRLASARTKTKGLNCVLAELAEEPIFIKAP